MRGGEIGENIKNSAVVRNTVVWYTKEKKQK